MQTIGRSAVLAQLDYEIAILKTKQAAATANPDPVVGALDRTDAMGGEMALTKFKLWVATHMAQEKRA